MLSINNVSPVIGISILDNMLSKIVQTWQQNFVKLRSWTVTKQRFSDNLSKIAQLCSSWLVQSSWINLALNQVITDLPPPTNPYPHPVGALVLDDRATM